jgi:6-phosphogluconate dehydrogenase
MVHNGIEYGDMQLICEAYAILKNVLGLSAAELGEIFSEWNQGELNSYLTEITARIFTKTDGETGKPIVDLILDKAGQKGTGKWTVGHATEMGVPLSTIASAVEARIISSVKSERVEAAKILPGPTAPTFTGDRAALIQAVRDALYASKIVSYAQGFVQLGAAGSQYGWQLNFGDIATIWRGGCIIRAHFLNRIKQAYERNPGLKNLLLDPFFSDIIIKTQANWRHAISTAIAHGIAAPAFSASLAYYDSYRAERLPANLLQAQRDFFGAHTYERVDKPAGEFFHTEWLAD